MFNKQAARTLATDALDRAGKDEICYDQNGTIHLIPSPPIIQKLATTLLAALDRIEELENADKD